MKIKVWYLDKDWHDVERYEDATFLSIIAMFETPEAYVHTITDHKKPPPFGFPRKIKPQTDMDVDESQAKKFRPKDGHVMKMD